MDCEGETLKSYPIVLNSKGQVVVGYLQCTDCYSHFPIANGVLLAFEKKLLGSLLLPEEIDVIEKYGLLKNLGKSEKSPFEKGQVQTHKNWTYQWLKMDTDTFENDWGKPLGNLEQFHYYDIPIDPDNYDNKVVCEAGCGFGRVIRGLHKRPVRYIAFDLSGSVYKAIKLYPESEKLDVIRANILSPPFKKEVFDILFCPRALHHTGNLEYGIEKLHSLIKREGVLAFSVYSQENNFLMWGIVEPLKGVVNRFLPDIILLGLASMLAALFKVVISFL